MKRYFKIPVITIILLIFILLFASCSDFRDNDETVRVMLTYGDGVTVHSENPIDIKRGEDAVFKVSFDNGYVFDSLNEGVIEQGTVTLAGVTRNKTLKLSSLYVGYDTTVDYKFYFNAGDSDSTSLSNSSSAGAGTLVSVSAGDVYRRFVGWSFNSYTQNPEKIVSTDRSFSFRLSPDIANSRGVIRLYANYTDANSFYYDPSGGQINQSSTNLSENGYYMTEIENGLVKVTLGENYSSLFECAFLFFDDGSFTREGYVLTEYNTEPDGSGVGYSPGAQYFPYSANGVPTLYCIWQRAASPEQLTYRDYSLPCPIRPEYAENWHENGVIITGYTGDDDTVVIPEKIDGKPVIAIDSGAIVGKSMRTLVLSRNIVEIKDGAITKSPAIEKIYYPDGVYTASNDILDKESYTSLRTLCLTATIAPRYSDGAGALGVKLSRALADDGRKKIFVLGGSSVYQGLSSEYMEALLGGEYRVINFGTTRTTNGIMYLEAMSAVAKEGDIVIYAPENSSYMFGENELYWKTFRDLENMYNIYRYVDIGGYTNVFGAISDFNKNYRYTRAPRRYEDCIGYMKHVSGAEYVNKYGECMKDGRNMLAEYIDAYYITLNNRVKSKNEGEWGDIENQLANSDYSDKSNITWQSIDEEPLLSSMSRAIERAKSSGASVYFSFCPVDGDKLVKEARSLAWTRAYDRLIAEVYPFDGVLGESASYVFAHGYFYDCAFHLNDYGRTLRTYRLYLDLSVALGFKPRGFTDAGANFAGCLFEEGNSSGVPRIGVDYLSGGGE